MNTPGIYQSNVQNYTCRRGKVRDIYDLGDTMLIIVTSDRISAFDYVFPNTVIPDKGKVLNKLSAFWADRLDFKYHLVSMDLAHFPEDFRKPEFEDRTMLVEEAEVIPFECVVRGYLAGSAWKEYKSTGEVCGIKLPPGMQENQHFPKPIFTPAIKNDVGHDENVSFEYMAEKLGLELSAEIEAMSIELYEAAAQVAWNSGIIIADTKFEWGLVRHLQDALIVVDEVLTPDSSRFWPLEKYKLGGSIESFDKQYLRDWAEQSGWDKQSEPPPIPEDVVAKTREKYIEAFEKLTGTKF